MRHHERIRRAAILVGSLDERLSRELLRDLPAEEVAQIEAELKRLDDVDPDEQREVLEEFRRSQRTPQPAHGVEFAASPQAQREAQRREATAEGYGPPAAPAQVPLLAADRDLLARLLAKEHPQTIAAVLQRLGAEQGGPVFGALPAELQGDVLRRVAESHAVDEAALTELEQHLTEQVQQLQDRRRQQAAADDFARRLVRHASHSQREPLLERLTAVRGDEAIAATAGADRADHLLQTLHATAPADVPSSRDGQPTPEVAATSAAPRPMDSLATGSPASSARWPRLSRLPGRAAPTTSAAVRASVAEEASPTLPPDCSAELARLDDRRLLAAIQSLDERTVLRALAASTDVICRRVERRLPRSQSSQLRSLVRSLGPTSLIDLRSAQHALLAAGSSPDVLAARAA